MRIGCPERNFIVNSVLLNIAAFSRKSAVVITASLTLLLFVPPVIGQPKERPLSDLRDTQGTFCGPDGFGCTQFLPPVRNFVVWSDLPPNRTKIAIVDYFGFANDCFGGAFGTTWSGKITERALADGTAEVTVLLFTDNALTWVVDYDSFVTPPAQAIVRTWMEHDELVFLRSGRDSSLTR